VNPSGVSILQELFIELAVSPEVLTEIQEDVIPFVFKIEFVPADSIGSVINGKRYQFALSIILAGIFLMLLTCSVLHHFNLFRGESVKTIDYFID